MTIRRAVPEEAAALTQVALAAKAHWGYPQAWLDAWAAELTIAPEFVRANPTFVAIGADAAIVGFHTVVIDDADAMLDHLWIVPAEMRRGIGRALFAHAEGIARAAGAKRMLITGDPHAAGFYERMGASVYGRRAAPMDGQERFLPLLEKTL